MASLKQLATSSKVKNSLIYYDSIYFLSRMCNFFSSFSNSKIFASAKTCRGKSCGTIVWNMSAIKTANVNLVHDGKMADQVGNSIFVLKLVSGGFRSQNNNLSPTSLPVAYFKDREKWASIFPSNVIAATCWFQYK